MWNAEMEYLLFHFAPVVKTAGIRLFNALLAASVFMCAVIVYVFFSERSQIQNCAAHTSCHMQNIIY